MIYYYCTNSTFASIIGNRSLWLSDMTQSNDRYEITRYVELVEKAVEEARDAIPKEFDRDVPKSRRNREHEYDLRRRDIYTKALNRLKKEMKSYYCLAICFSDVGDNLSQWRGYGDDGFGISIGFDEARMEELCDQHRLFKFKYVQYYGSVSDSVIQDNLKRYLAQLDDLAKEPLKKKSDEILKWVRGILDDDAPFIKPAGFVDEQESRFCYVRYISPYEMLSPKDDSHLKNVNFHVSRHAIVPHYVLKLQDGTGEFMNDVIREVVIGPCNYSHRNTIESFLAKNGFDISKIKVRGSDISYQARP